MKSKNWYPHSSDFFIVAAIPLFMLLFAAGAAYAQFRSPESVIWDDANERYIVSNMGNSRLLEMDEDGDATNWVTAGLNQPKGLTILDGIIYVADVTYVRGFSLDIGNQVMNLLIEDAIALNDMANDGTYLYVTDSNWNKIHKIDVETVTSTEFVTAGLSFPNGLLHDPDNNRLLLCSYRVNSPIQAINLANGNVSTVVNTTLDNLDGLAVDSVGRVYVSSWGSSRVYRWNANFNQGPEEVSSGHNRPADICINMEANYLIVPNFYANTISFVDLTLYSEITLPEESYDFGAVLTGDSADWAMCIENRGEAELEILTAVVNEPFSIEGGFEVIVIAPGETDTLYIEFSPDSVLLYEENLILTTNDPDNEEVTVPLYGMGWPLWQIVLPDTAYDFGGVVPGDTAVWAMSINNAALDTLIVFADLLDTSSNFRIEEAWTIVIPASGADTLHIGFTPPDTGIYLDTLILTSNDPNHPVVSLSLSGEGVLDGIDTEAEIFVPNQFEVSEVFPSPFNSSAFINVSLPRQADLRVEVFNAIGRRVAILTDRRFNEGIHSINFNAEGLPSGIYYIKITVPAQLNEIRKAVLIR